jgi:hypothetical protein
MAEKRLGADATPVDDTVASTASDMLQKLGLANRQPDAKPLIPSQSTKVNVEVKKKEKKVGKKPQWSTVEDNLAQGVNNVRMVPDSFVKVLEKRKALFHGGKCWKKGEENVVTKEGVPAVDEGKNETKTHKKNRKFSKLF